MSIAEKMAANQKQVAISEFFEKNKHFLGFDTLTRALITAVKEAVDNALDACEEARILPDIVVQHREGVWATPLRFTVSRNSSVSGPARYRNYRCRHVFSIDNWRPHTRRIKNRQGGNCSCC